MAVRSQFQVQCAFVVVGEASFVSQLKTLLERHCPNADSACASDVESAVRVIQSRPKTPTSPTIVFADHAVPGGILNLLEQICSDEEHIARVAVIGSDPADRDALKAAGAHSLIPDDENMLDLAVRYWSSANVCR